MSSIIKSPKSTFSTYLIKHNEEPKLINEDKEMESPKHTAEHLIKRAEEESRKILQDAELMKQEAETFIEQEKQVWLEEKVKMQEAASQIGYQEGYGEGRRNAQKEYAEILEQMKHVLKRTKEQEEALLEEMEPQILEAVIRTANKIMNQSIEEDPNRFLHLVKRVVREVKEEKDVRIYVHPNFYDVVFENKEDLKALIQQEAMLTIYPEESLNKTQCIVESSFGRIEGGIDDQLQQIKQALAQCLEKG